MPRKKIIKKTVHIVKHEPNKEVKKEYLYAIGRRKSARARVRMFSGGKGDIQVNSVPVKTYFPYFELHQIVLQPLVASGMSEKVNFSIKVSGGGKKSQAEAIRHGIARTLVLENAELRKTLKPLGYLKRDPREKERKKPGLHRARRAPQWQKR